MISNPNAPQNVHWSDTAIVNNSQYKLTLAWKKGNQVTIQSTTEANDGSGQGWQIKVADSTSKTTAYTIAATSTNTTDYTQEMADLSCYVTPGTSQTFYISEYRWTQPASNNPQESPAWIHPAYKSNSWHSLLTDCHPQNLLPPLRDPQNNLP